jgi:hypothetical protein
MLNVFGELCFDVSSMCLRCFFGVIACDYELCRCFFDVFSMFLGPEPQEKNV